MRAGWSRPTWRTVVGSLGAVAMALAGCGGDDRGGAAEPDGTEPLTLMLNWTPNGQHVGIYVAQARGLYADAGLDVQIVEPGTGGVAEALVSGRADVGILVAEGILPARAEGLPLVSIAAILPHNDSSLMARPGITRPRDLAGATYGGYGGPLETELIRRLVECDGGDPDAIDMVDIGNADYLAGMERGLFDAVWVFGGWDVLRARDVAGVEVSEIRFDDHLDCIPDWYTPLLAIDEGKRDDARVAAFVAATARGYAAAIEDPTAAAADFLSLVPEADRALIEASVAYYGSRFVDPAVGPWGTQSPQVWSAFAEFATEAGLLREPVRAADAFTNELIPG
jgi:ABC-type nitrate/sulfonate/bicarbonate transport system substrate-binding protein